VIGRSALLLQSAYQREERSGPENLTKQRFGAESNDQSEEAQKQGPAAALNTSIC